MALPPPPLTVAPGMRAPVPMSVTIPYTVPMPPAGGGPPSVVLAPSAAFAPSGVTPPSGLVGVPPLPPPQARNWPNRATFTSHRFIAIPPGQGKGRGLSPGASGNDHQAEREPVDGQVAHDRARGEIDPQQVTVGPAAHDPGALAVGGQRGVGRIRVRRPLV